MWESCPTPNFFPCHHVQRQRVVCDGLLRQDEAPLRRRRTGTSAGGKDRNEAKYVRSDDARLSIAFNFFPLVHAGKYLVEHDLKRPQHNDNFSIIFYCQVKGD